MPYAAPRVCSKPGCGALAPSGKGRCVAHAYVRRDLGDRMYDERRGTSADRGYDRRWRNVRERVLRREPLCRHCNAEGRTAIAVDVDHIVELRDGGARLDPANLQPLCKAHHSIKSALRVTERKHAEVLGKR